MLPSNILKAIQTWQPTGLAYLTNLCPIARNTNAKFKDFQKRIANLGETIQLQLPPDSVSSIGLVASWQASKQLSVNLTCDQARNTARSFTNQQDVFNLDADNYMDEFGRADVEELGQNIEINLGRNADSSVPEMTVNSDGQSVPTGALHTESGPYRFFGDGVTPINSYQQLAQMYTDYDNLGAGSNKCVFLPDTIVPAIIGTGLNQFVPERNNKDAQSWEIGEFGTPSVKYVKSNLLPTHISGTIGNSASPANVLTVATVITDADGGITSLTCTTPVTTDSEAIKSGDLAKFLDNVSGQVNMRYLTYRGHHTSRQPVQIRMMADAASSGGNITISFTPSLKSAPGSDQNINTPVTVGMKLQVMPSHLCGLLISNNAFYLAMPKLPEEVPYPTESKIDDKTALSLRMYYGSVFGKNQKGMINDGIWGSLLVPRYSSRVLFPIN